MRFPDQPERSPSHTPGAAYPGKGVDNVYPERPEEEERFDPRQYLAVLFSHWWLVLLVFVLGTAAGAAYCYLAAPVYRAVCRYEIFQDESLQIGQSSTFEKMQQRIGRHTLVMKSATLKNQVIDELLPEWGHRLLPDQLEPKLEIEAVRESYGSMVDISVDAASGDYALDYLATMLKGFQRIRKSEGAQVNESALGNLRNEQSLLAGQLEDAQEALLEFQQKHDIRLTEAREQMDDQFMANLIQRQNTLRMERTILESQFPFLENANTATIRDVLALTMETHAATSGGGSRPRVGARTNGSGVDALPVPAAGSQQSAWPERVDWQSQEERVASLEAEYEDKLKVYKPGHPKMVELNRLVEEARRNLSLKAEVALKRLKARYEALKMQENALNEAAGAWKQDFHLSTSEQAEHENLLSKAEHLKKLHDQVYSRILDSSASNVDKHFTRTVEAPHLKEGMIWPNKLKIMAAAVVAALGLGVGLAFALDYLDTGPLDIVGIEEKLGLRYLSGIPRWDRLLPNFHSGSVQIVMTRDQSSTATEAYRSLRVNLEHLLGDKGSYALLVTSGDAGEGKSFTCANTAIAFAWTGKRVLLVDGDLRNASLHRPLNVRGKKGLSDLLAGRVTDWHDLVQPTDYDNLSFVPAGKYEHNVPELLAPGNVKQLVAAWREEYDLVIIDSAPVGRVVDTMTLAGAVDGVLLVVGHEGASFGDVRHSLRRLTQANVVGFSLNAIDLPKRPYYYRGYGKYGHYGRYSKYYSYYRSYYGSYYGSRYGEKQGAEEPDHELAASSDA